MTARPSGQPARPSHGPARPADKPDSPARPAGIGCTYSHPKPAPPAPPAPLSSRTLRLRRASLHRAAAAAAAELARPPLRGIRPPDEGLARPLASAERRYQLARELGWLGLASWRTAPDKPAPLSTYYAVCYRVVLVALDGTPREHVIAVNIGG